MSWHVWDDKSYSEGNDAISRFTKKIFNNFIIFNIHYNVRKIDFFVRFFMSEVKVRIELIKTTPEAIQFFIQSKPNEKYVFNVPEPDPWFYFFIF